MGENTAHLVPDWPTVTVILPIRNEEAFVARCLGAVLAQDYPADRMEVLVVDGMSDDRTRAVVAALPGADRVRVLDNPNRNQAAAMNTGIAAASGEYIVRVDGHTIINPDYARRCVTTLRETGAANVGGAMDPAGITPMGRAIALAGKSAFAVPTAFHVSQQAQYTDTVYLGAWPAMIFDEIGGYDEHFVPNEDYELNYRIRAAGGRIYFDPAIKSTYYGRQNLRALWRQYYRYGQGKVRTLRQHPTSLKARQLVAPMFVAGLVTGPLLGSAARVLRVLWLLGLGAYGLLNLYFTARIMQRAASERDVIWRVPLVFLTIHLAWGLGFWRELLTFRE